MDTKCTREREFLLLDGVVKWRPKNKDKQFINMINKCLILVSKII
jgi:hypothetical protein